MKTHSLKILPPYFEAVQQGLKTFEVRYNDRGFSVGDVLYLREYDPGVLYTGRVLDRRITYIVAGPQYGIADGFVVLALGPV